MICNISGLFMTATYGQVYIWFAYVYVYICGYFPRCNSTLDERYYVLLNLNAMHVYLHCNLKKKLYQKFQLSKYVKLFVIPRRGSVEFDPRSWQDFWYQSAPGYLPTDCHTRHSISKNKKCTFLPLIMCSPLVNVPWSFKGKYYDYEFVRCLKL